MAWVVQLVDATSSVDLNDGTNYFLNLNGLFLSPPPVRRSLAGEGLFSHGSELISRSYGNREVKVNIDIKGTDADGLATNVRNVWDMLRRAEEWSKGGLGTAVQLKYQWDGATYPVWFDVLEGELDPGDEAHSPYLSRGTRLRHVELRLQCLPFAVGTTETIQNYLSDPSFEIAGSALADWSITTATGTISRDTTKSKYGTASTKFVRTANNTDQDLYQRFTTGWSSGDNISLACWSQKPVSTAGMSMQLKLTQRNSAGTDISTATDNMTATGTVWVQQLLTGLTVTADAATGTIEYKITLRGATVGSGTGYADGCIMVKASTIPKAWASGRGVRNHFDDNGQSHINYLDIYDVPGDVPALLQVKASELEAHTDLWIGARHASRQGDASIFHEAEGFATWSSIQTGGSPTLSGGSFAREAVSTGLAFDVAGSAFASATGSLATSVSIAGSNERFLMVYLMSKDPTGNANNHSVKFNSTAMTNVTRQSWAPGGSRLNLSVWQMKEAALPASGTYTIDATSGAVHTAIALAAVHLVGVAQGTPIVGTVFVESSMTDPSANTPSEDGNIVVVGIAQAANDGLSIGSGTQRANTTADNALIALATTGGTSGNTKVSWVGSGNYTVLSYALAAGTVTGSPAVPLVRTKSIAIPPRGQYRVLSRLSNASGSFRIGIGYSYGGVTADPNVEAQYLGTLPLTGSTWNIQDLGGITVPPVDTPVGQTAGSLILRLAFYRVDTTGGTQNIDFDWVMLMPSDAGFCHVNKTSAVDVVMPDSRSIPRAVYLLNTADVVQSIPADQVGDPPEAHPKGTRLYFVSDNGSAGIGDGWNVSVTYTPRFLVVR